MCEEFYWEVNEATKKGFLQSEKEGNFCTQVKWLLPSHTKNRLPVMRRFLNFDVLAEFSPGTSLLLLPLLFVLR
jgi:hypothetical protein